MTPNIIDWLKYVFSIYINLISSAQFLTIWPTLEWAGGGHSTAGGSYGAPEKLRVGKNLSGVPDSVTHSKKMGFIQFDQFALVNVFLLESHLRLSQR